MMDIGFLIMDIVFCVGMLALSFEEPKNLRIYYYLSSAMFFVAAAMRIVGGLLG